MQDASAKTNDRNDVILELVPLMDLDQWIWISKTSQAFHWRYVDFVDHAYKYNIFRIIARYINNSHARILWSNKQII